MRYLAVALFLMSAVVMGGCNNGQDTNETLYISIIGIDVAADKKVNVTYQFEDFNKGNNSSDNSASQEGSKDKIITIKGENVPQTIDFLASIISRTPNFSHIRAIVFGEEMARRGIYENVVAILRLEEFRNNSYILVVNNGTASEFIAKNEHSFDSSASKYIETQMALSKNDNIFLKSNVHEFYNRMKSNSAAPFAALAGVNRTVEEAKKAHEPKADIDPEGIFAGEIPRTDSVNPVELAGTALFRRDKMIGKLSSKETEIVSILKKDFRHAIIQIDDPYAPGYQLSVNIEAERNPDIIVTMRDGRLRIGIALNFICELKNIPSAVDYDTPGYRDNLTKIIADHMTVQTEEMLKKSQSMGADVVGFGYQARTLFKTYPEFMAITWDALYAQAEFDVDITAKIKNSSFMRRSTPLSPTGF